MRNALPDFLRVRGGSLTFDHFSLAEWLTRETEDGFARAGDYAVDLQTSMERMHRWALQRVDDGTAYQHEYLLRHLAAHLTDEGERQQVFAKLMLQNYEWLAAKLACSGIDALTADCEHLGSAAQAPLLLALLRNSAHVLKEHPAQLPAQLLGRIASLGDADGPLAELADSTRHWLENQAAGSSALRSLVPTTGSLRLSSNLLATLTGHTGSLTTLAVLPDGRIASGADDNTVRVWDPQGQRPAQVLEGHAGWVNCLAVLPDGRIASGAGDNTVRVWDPRSGRQLAMFHADAPITALLAHPSGLIVAGDQSGAVHFLRRMGGLG